MDRLSFNPFTAAQREAAQADAARNVGSGAHAGPHPQSTTLPVVQIVSVHGVAEVRKIALYDWSFYDTDYYGA